MADLRDTEKHTGDEGATDAQSETCLNNTDASESHDASSYGHRLDDDASPEPPPSWKPDLRYAGNNDENNIVHTYDTNDENHEQDTDVRFSNSSVKAGTVTLKLDYAESQVFASARKYATIAQVCALVSLFIGGVILSAVSLGMAYFSFRKLGLLADAKGCDAIVKSALRRPAVIALAMAAIALVCNVAMLVYVYPLVMQSLQSSDVGSLFGSGQGGTTSAGSGSSTWG